MKGTITIEEAIIDPAEIEAHTFARCQSLMRLGSDQALDFQHSSDGFLISINERLKAMDKHGVEYILLSLTSPRA